MEVGGVPTGYNYYRIPIEQKMSPPQGRSGNDIETPLIRFGKLPAQIEVHST
jgi:hypothetical protein